MTTRARGTFDVKLSPRAPDGLPDDAPLGRLILAKRFEGDLAGTSKGEMVAFRSAVEGSAGYVALECVTGTLNGRNGSFALQHSSTMRRGEPHQSIQVVPDSGTGELTGLSGTMVIIIAEGKHSYEFDYAVSGER